MSSIRADAGGAMMGARQLASFGRRHALAIWIAVVSLLTVALVVRHWQEVGQIAEALRDAHPRWVLAGIGIEIVTIAASALTYRILLRRLGHPFSLLTLAGIHLRRSALGALFFLNGPASVYVFLRILKQRRVPVEDGLLTIALRSIAGQVAFTVVIVAALVVHGTNIALIVVGVVIMAAVAAAPLVRSRWQWHLSWTNRLPFGIGGRAMSFVARLRGHRLKVRDLTWPVVLMAISRIGPVGLMFASLRALEVETTFGIVTTAYLAAVLAHTMVPIFQGVGVVEAAAAVALQQSGVPAETAIGVALLWRLMDFWMIFASGLAIHAVASLGPRVATLPAVPTHAPRPRPSGPSPRPTPSAVPVAASVLPHATSGLTRRARHDPAT